jgi:hypothetical protein
MKGKSMTPDEVREIVRDEINTLLEPLVEPMLDLVPAIVGIMLPGDLGEMGIVGSLIESIIGIAAPPSDDDSAAS